MKKTFCDCCGNQFDPVTEPESIAINKSHTGVLIGHNGGETRVVEVTVGLAVIASDEAEEADICGTCRWSAIDKIDPRPRAHR